MKWLARIGGVFLALIVGFFIYLGSDFTTDIAVQTGEEMPKNQMRSLLKAGLIDEDETVLYYYSEAFFHIATAGTIVTNKDVTGYWTENDEREVMSYRFEDIRSVELEEAGDSWNDALYWVYPLDEESDAVGLILSVEDDGHLNLIKAIEDRIPARE